MCSRVVAVLVASLHVEKADKPIEKFKDTEVEDVMSRSRGRKKEMYPVTHGRAAQLVPVPEAELGPRCPSVGRMTKRQRTKLASRHMLAQKVCTFNTGPAYRKKDD